MSALPARRVLEIGTGDARRALRIAGSLAPDGLLITVERDPSMAAKARDAFSASGHAGNVSVLVGDPSRYLHKVAGPFDLIVQDGQLAGAGGLHERLWQLLRPSGVLVTHRLPMSGGYNEQLAADIRFDTIVLSIGDAVAMSAKRPEM